MSSRLADPDGFPADRLSLKAFLGYGPTESTPDHSSLTKIQQRLPAELYAEVFQFVLTLVEKHQLISATVVGVDSTTLEANAAMKRIVRKDNDDRTGLLVVGSPEATHGTLVSVLDAGADAGIRELLFSVDDREGGG